MSRASAFFLGILAILAIALIVIERGGETVPGGASSSSTMSAMSGGSSTATSRSSAVAQGRELSCEDARDNDGDRLLDCDDPDCASTLSCRCGALSCGESGARTCSPSEGCICDDALGCMACRQEDQTCGSDADCCQGMGLSCQTFLTGPGQQTKKCAPLAKNVCDITCEGNAATAAKGTWGTTRGCAAAVPPPGAPDCETLVGACDLSQISDRNTVKCWQS